ncbi:MAG: ATP-binding cassette domain-containing protein [Bauldia sp.]|nr:ATP-binding cassette domain-containing protein [Bauldia sp.]MCW5718201.1 ATP-binding cassette domain-containing protein [Bauldia sp.]
MDEASPILEFRRVEKRFGRVRALDGIDVAVRSGELVAVLGTPGAGTSTMVKLAAALLRPDRGVVAVLGRDLRTASRDLHARMGFAFEEPELDGRLTVDGHLRYRAGLMGLGSSQARAATARALAGFGLAERGEDRAGVLSVTSRRQLALARAALGVPVLIAADRSADGLDDDERSSLLEPLLRLRSDDRTAILLTTAEPAVAASADRIVVLHRGRIAFDGTRAAFGAAGSGDVVAAFAALVRSTSEETAGARV